MMATMKSHSEQVTEFFHQMDKDLQDASREEVDEFCRARGWPTITEQENYWKGKAKEEAQEVNAVLDCLLAMKGREDAICKALEGLSGVLQHMLEAIRRLSERL